MAAYWQPTGEQAAVLRGDSPEASRQLRHIAPAGVAPEYYAFATEIALACTLRGAVVQAERVCRIDLDELAALVQALAAVSSRITDDAEWEAASCAIGVTIQVASDHVGPSVACRAYLAEPELQEPGIAHGERAEIAFASNLPWLDGFLAGLRAIVASYHRFHGSS